MKFRYNALALAAVCALGTHAAWADEAAAKKWVDAEFQPSTLSKDQQVGNIIPATITVFTDNSFTFSLGTPPTAQLIRKAAGVEKGSGVPNRNKVGKITRAKVKEIAELKMKDLNAIDMAGAMKQVEGSARSMGIDVIE